MQLFHTLNFVMQFKPHVGKQVALIHETVVELFLKCHCCGVALSASLPPSHLCSR